MGTISITQTEYEELLYYKKIVQNFEDEIHKNDLYLKVAEDLSQKVEEGKEDIFDETEVL